MVAKAPVRAKLAWEAMPDLDFYTAETWLEANSNWITAIVTVVLAIAVAEAVDRALSRRGQTISAAIVGGDLSPVAATRLRLIRRLIFALIIVLGLALAAAQFPNVKRLATGVLASSAVLGIVIGFAARATLANAIAGIMLAITQPIRIGDLVTYEDDTGEVEDMKLTYTYIRLDNGQRLIVPNEQLAQTAVRNHTILDPRLQVEVSVWVPPSCDVDRALELIVDPDEGIRASAAEVDKEGVRLTATTWCANAAERGAMSAALRQRWLRLLREHGLSSEAVAS
jgi:small-conductance mechanosensitive channel